MKVLVSKPTYFDIEYEINPWMHMENKVNHDASSSAHKQLVNTYKNLGVEIIEIDQDKELPDMVYTANLGYAEDKKFIVANFKYKERKPESKLAAEYFSNLGFEVVNFPEDILWEGEGDFLKIGNEYIMGYGKRSDKQAAEFISEQLGSTVHTFELVNPFFYHLDTAIGPLSKTTAIVNRNSFTDEGFELLQSLFPDIILTNETDNKVMAPNLTVFNNTVVIGKGISEELKGKLKEREFAIKEVDMREFLKGGGSIKCLSLLIHESNQE